METYTQTNAPLGDRIPENSDYFPGISEMQEIVLKCGRIITLVRCPFSSIDFATQTEQSKAFNTCVDETIATF